MTSALGIRGRPSVACPLEGQFDRVVSRTATGARAAAADPAGWPGAVTGTPGDDCPAPVAAARA